MVVSNFMFNIDNCRLLLLLDTDAVVADFDIRLEEFALKHGKGKSVIVTHVDAGTLNMTEEDMWKVHGIPANQPWMKYSRQGGGNLLNAGVLIFQKVGTGERLAELLSSWWYSALREPPEVFDGTGKFACYGDCLRNWPHEQAVLELFIWPCFYEDISVLPLQAMNGFSGKFVRHLWGCGGNRRMQVLLEMLWLRDPYNCYWQNSCAAA